MIEIERKFLVNSHAYRHQANAQYEIAQGFLNTDPSRTVRVRIKGDKAYMTVKGKSNQSGTSRFEWEQEIAYSDAKALLQLCEATLIEKIRYVVPIGKHLYEVDEFQGANTGLVVAEIELEAESDPFQVPDWLGIEITGDARYYNSQLSKTPYELWKK